MKVTEAHAMRIICLSTLFVVLPACSYDPEDPGQWKLVCGSSIIAGNDSVMSIKVMSLAVDTECATTAAGQAVGPFKAAFLIGENILDEKGAVIGVRPVPNISIEPLLIGNRPPLNNENDADTRYRGLLTLKDNWCSDACGLVTLDAASVCPGIDTSNNLSVQIHSGALFSDAAIFPIKTKAAEVN